MTAHKLAKALLKGPDLPVFINGWGSDEGLGPFEVSKITADNGWLAFDYKQKKYKPPKSSLFTRPLPKKPDECSLTNASIKMITPEMLEKMAGETKITKVSAMPSKTIC